jgi:plasmid stabilization system protein ParE
MAKKIRWSKTSKKQLQVVISYLISNWGVSTTEKFLNTLEKRIYLLGRFPTIGKKSFEYPSIRQLVLTKHNTLLYEIQDDTIFIVEIYDNRQQPQ